MGKAPRKKQIRAARESAGQLSSKPVIEKKNDVQPILHQLEAESIDERIWACASLAMLLSEGDMSIRRLIASHKVVDLLIGKSNPQGKESEIAVRAEALGALRNYAVEGGQEVCAEMYNKGLLPVLLAQIDLLSTVINHLQASSTDMQADVPQDYYKMRNIIWDWTENVLTLVWCLAESAPKALPTLSSRPQLIPFCLNILGLYSTHAKLSPTMPTQIPLTVLHVLSTLSESNPTFALPFLHLDLDCLITIIQPSLNNKDTKKSASKYLIKVLAISVILNIVNCTTLPLPASSLLAGGHDAKEEKRVRKQNRQLAEELKHILDYRALQTLVAGISEVSLASLTEEDDVQNLQIGLEVLGIFANSLDGLTLGEEEEQSAWNGIDHPDEENIQEQDETLMDTEDELTEEVTLDMEDAHMNGEEEPDLESAIAGSMSEVIQSTSLPSLLLNIASSSVGNPSTDSHTDHGLISTAQNTPKTSLENLKDLTRLRALEALNNLLFTLTRASTPSQTLLPAPYIQSIWEDLFSLLLNSQSVTFFSQPADFDVALLGCILASAKMGLKFLKIGSGETPLLLSIIRKDAAADEVQIRTISVLAILGTRSDVTVEENKTIGETLITPFKDQSKLSGNPSVLTEALDALIDLYSDETRDYDVVFQHGGFLAILKHALPLYKTTIKAVDRRKFPEIRYRSDGVITNLTAFIKYRQSL